MSEKRRLAVFDELIAFLEMCRDNNYIIEGYKLRTKDTHVNRDVSYFLKDDPEMDGLLELVNPNLENEE